MLPIAYEDNLFVILGIEKPCIDKPDSSPALPTNLSLELRRHIFRAYPLCDRRCKKLLPDHPFRLDDRGPYDHFKGPWSIRATVSDSDPLQLNLDIDNSPVNDAVLTVVRSRNGEIITSTGSSCTSIRLSLSPGDSPFLRKLARTLRKVVGKGQSYPDSNWKWMAPRTADSLLRFGSPLKAFNPS